MVKPSKIRPFIALDDPSCISNERGQLLFHTEQTGECTDNDERSTLGTLKLTQRILEPALTLIKKFSHRGTLLFLQIAISNTVRMFNISVTIYAATNFDVFNNLEDIFRETIV